MHPVPLDSGRDLIQQLYRQHGNWDPSPRQWIFRGQADQRWPLIPKAFRAHEHLDVLPGGVAGPKATHGDQIRAEWQLFLNFLRLADRAALPPAVDDDTVFHHESWLDEHEAYIGRLDTIGVREWPLRRLVPNLALAQHHGVPTRMMDWSEDPLVAAYFAAAEAAEWVAAGRIPAGAQRFSVWALNLGAVATLGHRLDLEIVYTSRARNPRLHAQEGLFSVLRRDDRSHVAFVPEPLDDAVRSAAAAAAAAGAPLPGTLVPALIVFHVSLPAARETLRLLADEGYTAASIYVDHDGAARAIRERRWWDR